jgi:tetratricopeptide (TPR) repeat protein
MLRLRNLARALAAAVAAVSLAGVPAQAQTVQLEGVVVTKGADGKDVPVPEAQIDIFRTDINKGAWSPKADKRGRFTMLGIPFQAVLTVVVSAPGMAPAWQQNYRAVDQKPLKFVLVPGSGARLTLQEVQAKSSAGPAAGPGKPAEQPKLSAEEEAKRAEEIRKIEEQNAKITENSGLFNEKKTHFDAGIAAMQADNFELTITELNSVLQGLDSADPTIFNEMIHRTASNLAEAQYRVAVGLYNKGDRDRAKSLLESSAKNIARAIQIDSADNTYYAIQAKTGELLADKFNQADNGGAAAAAYAKLAAAETDAAEKRKLMLKAAEAYRLGFKAELNGAGDEAKAEGFKTKAMDAYKQVLAEDPKNADAIYGIALTNAGSFQKADWQTAANYYKLFLDTAPSDARAAQIKSQLAIYEKELKIKPQPIK